MQFHRSKQNTRLYHVSTRNMILNDTEDGCFCVRFVFSQGELMTEGGWAGVKVTPASEET